VSHDLRKVTSRGFQQEVVMVAHKAPYMNDRPISNHCRFQIGKKSLSVRLVSENGLLFIPP
jgi:hypothetical protein